MAKAIDIYKGLELILKYEPDTLIDAQHDVIYAGCYSSSFKQMTLQEKVQMEMMSWINDEETDSWMRYT